MKKFRLILFQLCALVIFAALFGVVALYQEGVFDITVLERESLYLPTEKAEEEEQDKKNETEKSLTEQESLSGITVISEDTAYDDGKDEEKEDEIPKYNLLLAKVPEYNTLKGQGYTRSNGVYTSENCKIARVTDTVVLPTSYNKEASTEVALYPYFGYIIMRSGNGYILSGSGKQILSGTNDVNPIYEKDDSDRAIFEYNGGYYVVDRDNKLLAEINFNPEFGSALTYNYDDSFNDNPTGLYRYYVDTEETRKIEEDTGRDLTDLIPRQMEAYQTQYKMPRYTKELVDVRLWGYTDAEGNVVIEAQYYSATDFNTDGYAFVSHRDGSVVMINTDGEPVIDPSGKLVNMVGEEWHSIVDGYYLPETYDDSSIGMFRFDDGLMRVREVFYDYYQRDTVVYENDILIYANNTKFAIPSGYKLKGYSNGILLLEKNGRYGYMDNTGKWIAQPIYTYARPFFEGLAVVGTANGSKCMIDTCGNIVVPFVFDYISDCSGGVITAYERDHGWTVFNKVMK